MHGINPDLRKVADRATQITNIDFGIPQYGGLRTPSEQYALFCNEKSKCDGISKVSYHQLGNALDFYAIDNGKPSWDKGLLSEVACSLLQAGCELGVKLEWGGLWGWDYGHIQRVD